MWESTSINYDGVAVRLVEAACSALDGDSLNLRARVASALDLLQGRCESRSTDVGAKPAHRGGLAAWQVRRIATYIDAHLHEKIAVEDLAALVQLSKPHFSRAFKQSVGVPAHAYVIRRRVETAQKLMLTTSNALSDIALSCGLSDQSHLTRLFRSAVGETPDSWRRSRRQVLSIL